MAYDSQTTARVSPYAGFWSTFSAYCELTKPSIVWLILMSTVIGGYMAVDGALSVGPLMHTLFSTALLAAGTGALNQWSERGTDARMRRTWGRPLPSGRVQPESALLFSTGLILAGLVYLLVKVNALSFALGLGTVVAYNFVYTALKTRTWWSTLLGAFPGAVPPLLGWAALRNELGLEAGVLFGILFLWQFPHFYSIAWMYREDYSRAGVRMLPVIEPSGASTSRQIVVSAAALIPLSIAPAWLGMASSWYTLPAGLLGIAYLVFGIRLARRGTRVQARELLRASVLYLPLLYLFLLVFKA